MSSQATKTNNDERLISSKIQLRIDSISEMKDIKVLELFGGEGELWNAVKKITNKNITILSIDKKKYKRLQLQGDNMKFIDSLDLSKFDVIDIDSYGSPFNQIKKIKNLRFTGLVHCTFIQSMAGRLNNDLLFSLGYTKKMIDKIPTLFSKNGIDKFKSYLANIGITEINIITHNRKNYLWFNLAKQL